MSEMQKDQDIVHETQKLSRQIQQVSRRANGKLVFIAKELEFRNREALLQLN